MKEKLTKNLSLKIIAIFFATSLWMISININDPFQSKDFSVVVQLQNMNVMTNAGKYVEVVNESDEISVRVRGNRSVMDNFSGSNIVATADLNEMNENNQVPIRLSTIKTSGNKIESIRSDDEYLTVKVEDIRWVQKKIEVLTKNSPAEGYILGRTTTEQNALKISGPESVVNTVARAAVTFDLEGATDDVSMLLPIELYDAEGHKISDSRLNTSINEVQCIASVLATKEVPVVFKTTGEPALGYSWNSTITSEPSTVLLAAKSSVIRGINQIEITDAIDIQNAKANVETTVDIRKYLPENVVLGDASFNGKINVSVGIEKEMNKTVEVNFNQIEIVNLPENARGMIDEEEETFTVELTGVESVMKDFEADNMKGYIDISQYMGDNHITKLEEGTYDAEVSLELPEGIWLDEEITAQVTITTN